MGDRPPVKPDYAILCDDIRQEKNGKLIAIGIYSGDILVKEFPGKLNLALLLHGQTRADCAVTIEIKYRGEFENAEPYEVTAKGDLQISELGSSKEFYVPVPNVPIELRGVGNLSISCCIDGNNWKNLLRKGVRLFDS